MKTFIFLFFSLISACRAESVSVYLDWFLNPHHAPLVIGIQKGFFASHGLDVKLIAAGGSEEGSRQVAARNADFAISKQSSHVVRVTNQSLPLVRIATLIDRPLECLISSYADIKSLKGKRIGYTSSSIEFATLTIKTILKHHHLSLDDITLVPITSSMTTAFLSGQVDAIFTAYRTFEVEDIRQHRPDVHVFYYEDHGVPSFDQVILVTHTQNVDTSKTLSFVRALEETCAWMRTHPEEAWHLYNQYAPEQNTDLNHHVFLSVVQLLVLSPGALNGQNYKNFGQFIATSDILTNPLPTVDQYARDVRRQ
jgi:putative hydroxymethylpyrimidine transport system substrate-binding protein